MAGDLNLTERAVWSQLPTAQAAQAAGAQAAYSVTATSTTTTPSGGATQAGERIIHQYGRLGVAATLSSPTTGTATVAAAAPIASAPAPSNITEVERLGLAALNLRESVAYRTEKANRSRAGEPWDMPGCGSAAAAASPQQAQAQAAAPAAAPAAGAQAAAPAPGPTSSFMEGSIAVGIIIVQGPSNDLKFSADEQAKVVAEVQNGLTFFANQNPAGMVSFAYDIRNVTIDKVRDNSLQPGQREAYFRDPAMASIGYSANWDGVVNYVNAIRTNLNTRWAYAAFFTKYPVSHFAYAFIGGPHLVMDYANDGWGPDNIDRVFAHETGHIFGAPDEYASSGCGCGGAYGRFGTPNSNCENCAVGGGVSCLMRANDFALCPYSRLHFGWQPRLMLADMGYNHNWRVELYPRYVLDITGDKRADIVGFGPTGVMVSLAQTNGTYSSPVQALNSFGYNAGGWRVENHPRMLADTSGDGLPDIVGFGGAWVQISRNLGGGSFAAPASVLNDFCYDQGWRVESHPRFAVDINGNGRADIVGFKDAGFYVSLAQADGSYAAPRLAMPNYGTVQGWTIADHPRFLADTTGSGRLDIVGFGGRGVLVSRQQADGTFSEQVLVCSNFCTDQGWRGSQHPRFVVDITGDGRADIVGFGPTGVVVSLAQADGTYSAPVQVLNGFGYNAGDWRVENHPRFLADTTGDGLPDIVGFGGSGVHVARNLGGGRFAEGQIVFKEFAWDQGWRVEKHPRFLADTNADGKADIVGFFDNGVQLALF